MVDRRVPGHRAAIAVSPAEVAAAKLQVKRARLRGEPLDPAVEAIANATPLRSRLAEFGVGAGEGQP